MRHAHGEQEKKRERESTRYEKYFIFNVYKYATAIATPKKRDTTEVSHIGI